jgi:hypothetical protein
MIRKILTLISFGCLWPGIGAAQQVQVQVPVTLQAPQADTTALPRVASHVSLEDLVREALQKNPAIQSALHSVAAQRRRVAQAKTLPDPMVGIGWAGNITPFSVQSGDPSSYRAVTAPRCLKSDATEASVSPYLAGRRCSRGGCSPRVSRKRWAAERALPQRRTGYLADHAGYRAPFWSYHQ